MKIAKFHFVCFAAALFLVAGCAKPIEPAPADTDPVPAPTDEAPTDDTPAPEDATPAEEDAAASSNEPTPDTTDTAAAADPKQRKYRFFYDVAVSELPPGTKARVWIPVAQNGPHQAITIDEVKLPAEHQETTEEKFGNKFLYFEGTANEDGEIPISVTYSITRDEVLPTNAVAVEPTAKELFLASSEMVPVDGSLTKRVFGDEAPTGVSKEKARQMYEAVESRMTYGKPTDKAWGRGDAIFACDEKVGNCTDFHSLFIALSRDQKMPAKFEIGFPISESEKQGEVGGYHCWAFFSDGESWLPVDISEADKHPEMKEYYFTRLTPDRVTFTQGRDLQLQPSPAAEKVNFVVYPYVEVDGEQHSNINKGFRFEEIE